jgi:hypothetical protein
VVREKERWLESIACRLLNSVKKYNDLRNPLKFDFYFDFILIYICLLFQDTGDEADLLDGTFSSAAFDSNRGRLLLIDRSFFAPKVTQGSEPMADSNQPKAEEKEDSKADSDEDSKADPKEDFKADSKNDSKDDSNEDSRADSNEDSKADSNEDSKADSNKDSKADSNEASKSDSNEDSKVASTASMEDLNLSDVRLDVGGNDIRIQRGPGSASVAGRRRRTRRALLEEEEEEEEEKGSKAEEEEKDSKADSNEASKADSNEDSNADSNEDSKAADGEDSKADSNVPEMSVVGDSASAVVGHLDSAAEIGRVLSVEVGSGANFQAFPFQTALAVFSADFIDSPESLAYDETNDRYFIHKGGIDPHANRAGFLSVVQPNGTLVAEDFGFCSGAAGMAVVRDVLYVAALGKVCAFNTTTLEQLPNIGEDEFVEHQLVGLTAALDSDAEFDTRDILGEGFAVLWVTDNGNASYSNDADPQLATDFEDSDNYVFADSDNESDSDPVVTTRTLIAAIRLVDLNVPEDHCYHCSESDSEYDSPRFDDSDFEDNERHNATVVIFTEGTFEKQGLFPDSITLDPATGTLFVTNAIGVDASDGTRTAGAVQKCHVVDEVDCDPEEDVQSRDYEVLCNPSPAVVVCAPLSEMTQSLTTHLDGFAKGIVLSAGKQLYFGMFNHTQNQSYIFRIADPYNNADTIDVLILSEPSDSEKAVCNQISLATAANGSTSTRQCDLPEDRIIDPGSFALDTLRNKILIPSVSRQLYYTLDLDSERGVSFESFVAREEGAPAVVVEVTRPAYVRAPDSIVYDKVHDVYIIHAGSLEVQGEMSGFLSTLSPQGELLERDFGFCQGALGMSVRAWSFFCTYGPSFAPLALPLRGPLVHRLHLWSFVCSSGPSFALLGLE